MSCEAWQRRIVRHAVEWAKGLGMVIIMINTVALCWIAALVVVTISILPLAFIVLGAHALWTGAG